MTVNYSPDELAELAASGMSDAKIAEHYGVASRTILRWRIIHDIPSAWAPVQTAEHGGSGARYARGCRCQPCREANTRRAMRRRQERRALAASGSIPETVRHGSAATAGNWGCRCDLCIEAVRVRNHEYQLAHKRSARS